LSDLLEILRIFLFYFDPTTRIKYKIYNEIFCKTFDFIKAMSYTYLIEQVCSYITT